MRVCPKCGYIDEPCWLHVKYSYYIDSCSFENFKLVLPELVDKMQKERIVTDKDNAYRLTKDNHWVERKALVDYGGQSFSDKCERGDRIPRLKKSVHDTAKYWQLVPPSQTKLLEDGKP